VAGTSSTAEQVLGAWISVLLGGYLLISGLITPA